MISLITALGNKNVIGYQGQMPWQLPADLAYFKKITLNHPVVMGHQTFKSIGRPLPKRRNLVLSHDPNLTIADCETITSLEVVFQLSKETEVFIIGGGSIYRQFLPYAEKLYLTRIAADFEGDTFFPEFSLAKWALISQKKGEKNSANPYDYTFLVYQKK